MTQQPYNPQQGYPPQQPFQQPYPAQIPPANTGYGYPPQGYAPAPMIGQAPPAQPLANGSIDEFYAQPSLGGGPGISWKGKPDGYTVQGVVSRDVTNGDISQEVEAPNTPNAGQPKFYRDGRPMFVMTIPLSVIPSQEFPEGEAKLYIRGQLRDELSRAMAEAQAGTTPAGGATITVTLVQRKQGRGAIPQNIFAVVYTPPGHPAPAIQQPAPQQYAQPMQPQYQQQQQAPQGYAQPAPQQYAPQAQVQQQYQAPAVQPVAEAQVPQMAPAAVPVQQQPMAPQQQSMAPQPPAGLTPDQQRIMSDLQAG